MAVDEKAIRTLLGIDEEADPADAIRGLQSTIIAQDAVIKTDAKGEQKKELAGARASAAEAQRMVLMLQAESDAKFGKIDDERRKEKATNKVDMLVQRGKVKPVHRDMTLELALAMSDEKFDAYIAMLPTIDLTERGVATGHDLAELEPTQSEIAIAKQMGTWNDAKPEESRLAMMRTKAKEKGLTLPAEVK